jgi:hypothetical protein
LPRDKIRTTPLMYSESSLNPMSLASSHPSLNRSLNRSLSTSTLSTLSWPGIEDERLTPFPKRIGASAIRCGGVELLPLNWRPGYRKFEAAVPNIAVLESDFMIESRKRRAGHWYRNILDGLTHFGRLGLHSPINRTSLLQDSASSFIRIEWIPTHRRWLRPWNYGVSNGETLENPP